MANITTKWNTYKKHYEIDVDEKLEQETVYIDGEEKNVIRCPYCGNFHDCSQVDDSDGDLHGLSIFCSEDCKNDVLPDLGKFCAGCGCFIPDGDEHDVYGYEDYCEECAHEAKAEDDDWETEKAHLRKCML